MVCIFTTKEFEERYSILPVSIQKKAERRTKIFEINPYTSILETEKLHPRDQAVWSFRIDRDYRIIFRFVDPNTVIFLTVGPHHWVYHVFHRFFR